MSKKNIYDINNCGWRDWTLNKIIDSGSGDIDIEIFDTNENDGCKLICKEYIGYTRIGAWDEGIIDNIKVEENGDLINECLTIIKQNYRDPDFFICNKKITDKWFQLNIKLIDGEFIKIACKDVEIKTIDLRIKV